MVRKIYFKIRATLDKWLLEDKTRNAQFAYITDAQFFVLERSLKEIATLKKVEVDKKDYEIRMKDLELRLIARNNELLKKNSILKNEMLSLLSQLDYEDVKLFIAN